MNSQGEFEESARGNLANKKTQKAEALWVKLGGGRSPRALSRVSTFGALAFAGCRLPDATPHGMRGYRSHGGIAPVIAGRSLLSEASSPSSTRLCRDSMRWTRC